MAQAIVKTNVGLNSAKLSNQTNIDLTVKNEVDFENIYGAFRDGVSNVGAGFKLDANALATRKREALWADLAAAAAVCEVLLDPQNADYLMNALEKHSIPPVLDPTKRNEFVPVCRLLWGRYEKLGKKAEERGETAAFVWDRSPETYGKALRGAKEAKIKPANLFKYLTEHKGFKSLLDADNKKFLKDDEDEKEAKRLYTALMNEEPVGVVNPPARFKIGNDEINRSALVAVLCRVNAHGQLDVIQRLPVSEKALDAQATRLALADAKAIDLRAAQRKAEAAQREVEEQRKENERLASELAALQKTAVAKAKEVVEEVFSEPNDLVA